MINDDNGRIRDQQPRSGQRNGPHSSDSSDEGGDVYLGGGTRAPDYPDQRQVNLRLTKRVVIRSRD